MTARATAPQTAPRTDVHRMLTYTDSRAYKQFLVIALALLAVGVLGVSTYSPYHKMYWPAWGMTIGGALFTLFCHFRIFNGQPLLTLSPKGLMLATTGKPVFIPWNEVRGIESISFRSWTFMLRIPMLVSFNNVAAVLISRDFYEDEIVEAYPTLVHHRVWSRTFRAKGDNLIQVCLHHDILPAKSEEIRKEVASRWYAFRDADGAADAPATSPATTPSHGAAAPKDTTSARAPKRAKVRDKVRFLVRWGRKPSS